MNKLFIKKLVLAFALGFVPVFLGGLVKIFDSLSNQTSGDVDSTFILSLLAGLVSGAIAAGLRAVIAAFTDWMPTDKLHGIGDNPSSVTVTKGS